MNAEQIQALAIEIRNGRTEDQSLELKQKWPEFRHPNQKDEFRKDIAALANSCGDGPGHIIFGLKEGYFSDAPLPYDEAVLQQIIREISPPPSVSFEEITVREGVDKKKISLVTVLPPYDRPYVTKRGEQNLVYVRHGSSIGTATHIELDKFFQAQVRLPELSASWEYWPGWSLGRDKGKILDILPILQPPYRMSDLENKFRNRMERHEAERRETGFPTREQIEAFGHKAEEFIGSLESRHNLIYWACNQSNFFKATSFSVVLANNGSRTATKPKARIQFPDWLYVADQPPERPRSYVPEPFMPRPVPAGQAVSRKPHRDTLSELLNLPGPMLGPREKPRKGSWTDGEGRSATFWATRLEHKHTCRIGDPVSVMALPTAPELVGRLEITAELFCEELSDWVSQTLELELIEREESKKRPPNS